MRIKTNRALLGAALSLALAPAAASATTTVSVRIEGAKKTLLPASTVAPPTAAVRRGGHSCPGDTGMGAFDRAVHGHWSGSYFSGLGFQPSTILGDVTDFTRTKSYFELFVNNVSASVGLCGLVPKRGQQILLAEVPATGTEVPLGLRLARTAKAGRPIAIEVVSYNVKGNAKPLAGTSLSVIARRNSHASGSLTSQGAHYGLTLSHPGTYTVAVSKRGYIRDEATIVVRS